MARIDHNAKTNPVAVLVLILLIIAAPALVVVLPGDLGTLAMCLILPAAGITLGFITDNVGKDKKYNRKLSGK